VKGAICQIVARDGMIRLDFIHGIRLQDPHRLLRGSGISKRYVPIPTTAYAGKREVAALIREASLIDPSLWSPAGLPPRGPVGSDGSARLGIGPSSLRRPRRGP
jgi:hypothetical protein